MTNFLIKDGENFYVKPAQGFVPKNAVGVVPGDIPKEDWPYLKATDTTAENGEIKWDITVDTAKKSQALAEKQAVDQVEAAYKTMSDEVDEKMYEVFRTMKPEYASAEYETWQDMLKRPAAYSPLGLKVDHQVDAEDGTELFSPGSALDTDAKITQYATRKIEMAEAYGTFRVKRIQQFKDEKASLLGG